MEQAERLWQQTENLWRIGFSDAILCWRFAGVDPAQARRIIAARSIAQRLMPQAHFYLALGAKDRDETISRQSVRLALQALDRVMEESPEKYMNAAGRLLSVVEQIDPALVPEVFWRHVASRLPYGNPRLSRADGSAYLIADIAVYDRDVAAVPLAPTLARMKQSEPKELATWRFEFLAWSLIDPRAAVARLEQTPIPQDLSSLRSRNCARFDVAASLARTLQEQWRQLGDRAVIFGGEPTF